MSASETKTCPFCAETIKAAAVLCRFCGRELPLPEASAVPTPVQSLALSAAATPASLIERAELFDLLTGLVEKSLVGYEEDERGCGRYRLLETVRQYGRDRLMEAGEAEAVRGRHLACFLALAEEAEPELWRSPAWLERLESEHDNLRAALDWSAHRSPETAIRLAGALGWFWYVRGHSSEARQRLEAALAGSAAVGIALRWKALSAAALIAVDLEDYEQATAWGEESLALCRQADDRLGIAWSLLVLGEVAHEHGEWERWGEFSEQALPLLHETGDKRGVAMALLGIGTAAVGRRERQRGMALQEQSLAICREEGYRWYTGTILAGLGLAACWAGQEERGKALLEEGLAINRELGYRSAYLKSLNALGLVAGSMADSAGAAALYEEMLVISREVGHKDRIVQAIAGLARACHAEGRHEKAWALLAEGEATARSIEDKRARMHPLGSMGHLARDMGDCHRAALLYRESLAMRQAINDRFEIARSLEDFAVLAARQGQTERAARLLGAAEAQCEAIGVTPPVAMAAEYEQAVAAVRTGLGEEAFAGAWADGRAMSLEGAMEYAVTEEETRRQDGAGTGEPGEEAGTRSARFPEE